MKKPAVAVKTPQAKKTGAVAQSVPAAGVKKTSNSKPAATAAAAKPAKGKTAAAGKGR